MLISLKEILSYITHKRVRAECEACRGAGWVPDPDLDEFAAVPCLGCGGRRNVIIFKPRKIKLWKQKLWE